MSFDYYAYELNRADGTDMRLKIMGETRESKWISINPQQRDAIIAILNEPEYGACHVCGNDAMDCYINGCNN